MCGSMVDIQLPTAEIRRGKKDRRKIKTTGKNIMSVSATQGGHKKTIIIKLKCMTHEKIRELYQVQSEM